MRKDFYDSLETADPDLRERELFGRLPDLVALAMSRSGWQRHLGDADPNEVRSRRRLARLPVLWADRLAAARRAQPPHGGFGAASGCVRRLLPSGALHPDCDGKDRFGAARAMFAAGMRGGDVVMNAHPYHRAVEGFLFDSGVLALGALVVPVGDDDPIAAADIMARSAPSAFLGSAGFLGRVFDLAGRTVPVRHVLVAGGRCSLDLRSAFADLGVDLHECLTHPDIGVVAYQSDAFEGLIVNEGLLVEVVEPETGAPVPEGETGEVVVTAFNPDYPMIRLAIGARAAVLRGRSPCGRTNMRLALADD